MRKLFLTGLSIAWICIIFSSCKKCKDLQHIELAKIMIDYFSNYKPGAYWIYLNRDSTKRDSIWVDNFEKRKHPVDRFENCISADEITFDINAKYLHYTKIHVRIGVNGSDYLTNIFDARYESQQIFVYFLARNDSSSFYTSNTTLLPKFYNYQLWHDNPNQIIPEVIQAGKLTFAPQIGLIQYIPPFGNIDNDTFSLIKHYFL